MRGFIGALAGALALAGSALAAPLFYGVQYFDANGQKVGTAKISLFVDNTAPVWQDVPRGGLCTDFSEVCQNLGFMTPFDIEGEIAGFSFFARQGLFDQGTLLYDGRTPQIGEFVRDRWEIFADITLLMTLVPLRGGPQTAAFFYQGIDGGNPINGTFRVAEVPLPAAFWLFVAGIGALRLRAARSAR